jgi:hypothetical protein
VTRFKGRTGRDNPLAFSTTVQFSSAITTHTTPTLPPLHNTKIPVTDTHPPHFTSHHLHFRQPAPDTQRDARAHAASSASHHHKAGSAPNQIAQPTTLLSHLHTTTHSVPPDSTCGNLYSRAANKSRIFKGHAHGTISHHTVNKRTDARKIRQRHGGRRDEVGRRARRAW